MDKKEIERFISKQKVGFVCSVDQDGFPNVKAMLMPRKRNGLKESGLCQDRTCLPGSKSA